MASIALMIGGALVNALAFSGSNYLFSKLHSSDHKASSDIAEERKRHDNAVEKMQAAHDAWSKRRTIRLDWVNEQLRHQKPAAKTYRDVEEAMREYKRVTGQTLDPIGPEPQLSDFYTPSDAQQDREIAFVVGGMAVTGLLAYYIAKRETV